MTFDIFKMIVNILKEHNAPKAHVGFTQRDDGLFSAVMCGIVMSSTKGSEYLNVNWGDGHSSRVKVLEMWSENYFMTDLNTGVATKIQAI